MRFYAGIGSRQTPIHQLRRMSRIAAYLEKKGLVLRSGGADGADRAFELGVTKNCMAHIFRPRDAGDTHIRHASLHHPAWDRCSSYARLLHARNSIILLGPSLEEPVEFVVCWTPGGLITGGTGQGLRIANAYDIPVLNLGKGER